MNKEELEEKIKKHVKDGFQMDYDGMDNLVDVFKAEEVVENILIESNEYAKQQAIEFNEWVESKRFMKHRGEWYDTKHDGQNWGTFPSYTKEQLYNLFINQKENK